MLLLEYHTDQDKDFGNNYDPQYLRKDIDQDYYLLHEDCLITNFDKFYHSKLYFLYHYILHEEYLYSVVENYIFGFKAE